MNYLTERILRIIHGGLSRSATEGGEPIPPFECASREAIDALIKLPQTSFFGFEQYPSVEEKAAIIFYTVNKKHLFENGNKRMSVYCFLMFLAINNYDFNADSDELTKKALWLASTTHEDDFGEIKQSLSRWIASHLHKLES